MCIGLAHDDVAAHGVLLTAEVAHHHTRRHARRTHQEDEAARVVLAETAVRAEEEIVDLLILQRFRLKRVGKRCAAKQLECGRYALCRRQRCPLRCQRTRLAVARRQRQRHLLRERVERAGVVGAIALRQPRARVIPHTLVDRLRADEFAVDAAAGAVARLDRLAAIERKQPALARRFQRNVVVEHAGRTAGCVRRIGYAFSCGTLPHRRGRPCLAIETPQHHAAPVERVERWRRADKIDAEGKLI